MQRQYEEVLRKIINNEYGYDGDDGEIISNIIEDYANRNPLLLDASKIIRAVNIIKEIREKGSGGNTKMECERKFKSVHKNPLPNLDFNDLYTHIDRLLEGKRPYVTAMVDTKQGDNEKEIQSLIEQSTVDSAPHGSLTKPHSIDSLYMDAKGQALSLEEGLNKTLESLKAPGEKEIVKHYNEFMNYIRQSKTWKVDVLENESEAVLENFYEVMQLYNRYLRSDHTELEGNLLYFFNNEIGRVLVQFKTPNISIREKKRSKITSPLDILIKLNRDHFDDVPKPVKITFKINALYNRSIVTKQTVILDSKSIETSKTLNFKLRRSKTFKRRIEVSMKVKMKKNFFKTFAHKTYTTTIGAER